MAALSLRFLSRRMQHISYKKPYYRSSLMIFPVIVGFGTACIGFNYNNNDKVSAMAYVNAGNLNFRDTSFLLDIIPNGFERCVEQNGKSLYYTGSKRIKFSDSTGYKSGKHEFDIKMNHGFLNQSYFGIYCEEDDTKYFIKSLGGIYKNKEKLISTRRWRIDERIKMSLDCEEGSVSFSIEKEKIDKIEIDKYKTYHVFVSAKARPDKGWATGFTII